MACEQTGAYGFLRHVLPTAWPRGMPDAQNVAAIRNVVDDVVLVSEEQMVDAVRRLYLEEGVLAEPVWRCHDSGLVATSAGFRSSCFAGERREHL